MRRRNRLRPRRNLLPGAARIDPVFLHYNSRMRLKISSCWRLSLALALLLYLARAAGTLHVLPGLLCPGQGRRGHRLRPDHRHEHAARFVRAAGAGTKTRSSTLWRSPRRRSWQPTICRRTSATCAGGCRQPATAAGPRCGLRRISPWGASFGIDEIMLVWSDAAHMIPAVNPAYCNVGAGVAKAANGQHLLHLAGGLHLRQILRGI